MTNVLKTVSPCRPILIFSSHYSVTSTRKSRLFRAIHSHTATCLLHSQRSSSSFWHTRNTVPIKLPSPHEDRTTHGGTTPYINLSTRQIKMWAFSSGCITSAAICVEGWVSHCWCCYYWCLKQSVLLPDGQFHCIIVQVYQRKGATVLMVRKGSSKPGDR
jgi:hypothetical protein